MVDILGKTSFWSNSESPTFQDTDKDRDVWSLAFTIAVQTSRCAQTIPVLGRCESRAKQSFLISWFRFFKQSIVILDAPDHRVVRDLFEISHASVHVFDHVHVLRESFVVFVQAFFVLHRDFIDELHVVDNFALVMFWQFLAATL